MLIVKSHTPPWRLSNDLYFSKFPSGHAFSPVWYRSWGKERYPYDLFGLFACPIRKQSVTLHCWRRQKMNCFGSKTRLSFPYYYVLSLFWQLRSRWSVNFSQANSWMICKTIEAVARVASRHFVTMTVSNNRAASCAAAGCSYII